MIKAPAKSPDACAHRQTSITRKLIWTLALLPIVPALAAVAEALADESGFVAPSTGQRWFHGLFAALWTVGFLVIWRSMIVWTLGRTALTAAISVVPFVQTIWAQPLWNAGCISDDVLQLGQHQICTGLYPWLAVWAWWGWERSNMKHNGDIQRISPRVSLVAQCIIRSIGSIPFVFGAFLIIFTALETRMAPPWNVTIAYELVAGVAIFVWILIWRKMVQQRNRVAFQAASSGAVMLGLSSLGPGLFSPAPHAVLDVILYTAPVMLWGIWMAGTVAFWTLRADPTQASATPKCPRCGYLLTGLRSTRCPECGEEPTLDELWTATAGEVI